MAAAFVMQPSTSTSLLPPLDMSMAPPDKYRGAVVEDLQLPPAFSLPSEEPIAAAIELAYDRDFSHIPRVPDLGRNDIITDTNYAERVLTKERRPLGYIDVAALKAKWEAGRADPNDKVSQYMTKFRRTASQPYSLITPSTCLADLELFLRNNIFALVTDYDRKFVLAVATSQDLENFVSRRGF